MLVDIFQHVVGLVAHALHLIFVRDTERVRFRRSKMPKIVEAMEVRHEVYNRQMAQINEKEARGEILVIRPPESLGISRTEHDPNELERVYRTGRREAYRMLPKVRKFLKG